MPQIKLAKLAAYEKQMTSGTERDAYFVAASGHEFGRLARRASFALLRAPSAKRNPWQPRTSALRGSRLRCSCGNLKRQPVRKPQVADFLAARTDDRELEARLKSAGREAWSRDVCLKPSRSVVPDPCNGRH
jgi:hypothetical protein